MNATPAPWLMLVPALVLATTVPAMASEPTESETPAPSKAEEAAGGESSASAKVERWIDELDDPSYETREAATASLMESEALSDTRLTRSLRSPTSPEQRHRLIRVAMHRYYRQLGPSAGRTAAGNRPGSLGIHTPSESIVRPGDHPKLEHPAMMVTKIYPGFPAFVHLRPRDLIYGIEGEPFGQSFNRQRFGELIKRHTAGERVSLMVLRDGKRIDVPVRLASYPRLEAVSDRLEMARNEPTLYPQWLRHRQELLGSDGGAPVVRIPSPSSTEDQQAAKPDDDGMSD